MRTIQKCEIGAFDSTTTMFSKLTLANPATEQVVNSILTMRSWMSFKITVLNPGTISIIGEALKFQTSSNRQATVQYRRQFRIVGIDDGALIVSVAIENKCPFTLNGVEPSIAALVNILEHNLPDDILVADHELNKVLGYYIPDNCPQETAQLCADMRLMVSSIMQQCTRKRVRATQNHTLGNAKEAKTALFHATIANLISLCTHGT